ncbi:MAG: hypothetical protein QF902_10590 [Rhodospirillales bacterium]|nr:hypothetical protein [Rhodospirillales bacterium]
MSRFIYAAQMNIASEHEAEFNRAYDDEFVGQIMAVPGIGGCVRYVRDSATTNGFATNLVPRYLNIWDADSPDVVKTPEWRAAVYDQGRWMADVWPPTFDRFHTIYRRLG